MKDFNIFVLRFSSLLEYAESSLLLTELALIVSDGTENDLVTSGVRVTDTVLFMGGLISFL